MADKTITQLTTYGATPATTDELPIWNVAGGTTRKVTAAVLALALFPAAPATGDTVYFNGTAWAKLSAGTAGQALVTGGVGVAPAWSTNFATNVVQAGGFQAPTSSTFKFSSAAPAYASDANKTLSATEYNCHDLIVTGAITATRQLIVPLTAGGTWRVYNNTSGGQSITVIGSSGTGVTIANAAWGTVRADGTNVVSVAAAGGGGSTPTGTGFVHVTGGAQDGAAQLVTNADVNAAAAIAVTKLALGAAGTVLYSDGATNAMSSLPIVSRVDVTSSYRVNGTHALGFSGTVLKAASQTTWTSFLHEIQSTGTFDWGWGGTTYLSASHSAAAITLALPAAAAAFTLSITGGSAAVAAPLTLRAQDTSAGTGGYAKLIAGDGTTAGGAATVQGGAGTTNGGAATIKAGDATTTGGALTLQAGTGSTNGTIAFNWSTTPFLTVTKTSTAMTWLAATSCTAITYGFSDLTTNSGTGGTMTVRAQNETGTSSIGGDMRIGPGSGTTRPGILYLGFGATDLVVLSFTSLAYAWAIDSTATSVAWSQANAGGAGTGAVFSITAQGVPSGTGGELRLGGGSGTGVTTHGAVSFYVGGAEKGRWTTGGLLQIATAASLVSSTESSYVDAELLAEMTISLINNSGVTANQTVYTAPSSTYVVITRVEYILTTAIVGASSVSTCKVGSSAGGVDIIASQALGPANAIDSDFGADSTQLGSKMDSTRGYEWRIKSADGTRAVVFQQVVSVANVTAGAVKVKVFGRVCK